MQSSPSKQRWILVNNRLLDPRTMVDIEKRVDKILRGVDVVSPPLDLALVRDLLELDRYYYKSDDQTVLGELVSKLKIAGKQVLKRPELLAEAIKRFNLKALYIPDRKRILLNVDLPEAKHRWSEGHEIGHEIIPWHRDMMLGDNTQTLSYECHQQIEAEANYAAGHLLFLGEMFVDEGNSSLPSFKIIKKLKEKYGNTLTSTMWRYIEKCHKDIPMFGLISSHPGRHGACVDCEGGNSTPVKYFIRSRLFSEQFSNIDELHLYSIVKSYCGIQRGGPLGTDNRILENNNGNNCMFCFYTFYNRYDALTFGYYMKGFSGKNVFYNGEWSQYNN